MLLMILMKNKFSQHFAKNKKQKKKTNSKKKKKENQK